MGIQIILFGAFTTFAIAESLACFHRDIIVRRLVNVHISMGETSAASVCQPDGLSAPGAALEGTMERIGFALACAVVGRFIVADIAGVIPDADNGFVRGPVGPTIGIQCPEFHSIGARGYRTIQFDYSIFSISFAAGRTIKNDFGVFVFDLEGFDRVLFGAGDTSVIVFSVQIMEYVCARFCFTARIARYRRSSFVDEHMDRTPVGPPVFVPCSKLQSVAARGCLFVDREVAYFSICIISVLIKMQVSRCCIVGLLNLKDLVSLSTFDAAITP